MKKISILFILASLILLAACAASGETAAPAAADTTAASASSDVLNTNYDNALPVPSQLALGTVMLKGTENEVTAAQAAELLPLWQALNSMANATSASAVEFNALLTQIEKAMQPAQLEAIANLKITQESMRTAFQSLGLNNLPGNRSGTQVARTPGATTSGGNQGGGGGFDGPPGGMDGGPGGGMGGMGGMGGGAFGGFPTGTVSPSFESTSMARATSQAQFGNPMLYSAVVSYLTQIVGQ